MKHILNRGEISELTERQATELKQDGVIYLDSEDKYTLKYDIEAGYDWEDVQEFIDDINARDIRDLLEKQILNDFCYGGDTTVLAGILVDLTDKNVFGWLSDENQEKVKEFGSLE